MNRKRVGIVATMVVVGMMVGIPATGPARADDPVGLTFFGWSDQHVGVSGEADHLAPAIDAMNGLPGTEYPAGIGGTVATPAFVLRCGDITEWPTTAARRSNVRRLECKQGHPGGLPIGEAEPRGTAFPRQGRY